MLRNYTHLKAQDLAQKLDRARARLDEYAQPTDIAEGT
jgi:hypothetical protein